MHEKHHCTGQLCIFCLSWEYKNVYQCPCTDFCVDNKLWPEARQTSTVTLTQWSFSVSRYRSVSYCFILTGQLQRWNVMVSLKWLEEPWVLTKVSFITRKGKKYSRNQSKVRQLPPPPTVCSFCFMFVDPENTKDKLFQHDNWPLEVN